MTYKQVAKKLEVRYLFGRWGAKLWKQSLSGNRQFKPRLIRLDGWIFEPHEIIEAFANDPEFSISLSPTKKRGSKTAPIESRSKK